MPKITRVGRPSKSGPQSIVAAARQRQRRNGNAVVKDRVGRAGRPEPAHALARVLRNAQERPTARRQTAKFNRWNVPGGGGSCMWQTTLRRRVTSKGQNRMISW